MLYGMSITSRDKQPRVNPFESPLYADMITTEDFVLMLDHTSPVLIGENHWVPSFIR